MPWTTSFVSLPTTTATLRVQVTLRGHSSAATFARSYPRLEDAAVEPQLPVFDPVGQQLLRSRGVLGRSAGAVDPALEVDPLVLAFEPLHVEPGRGEHVAPFLLGIVADVRGIVEAVGLLAGFTEVQVVGDEHEPAADARHLLQRAQRILEVMRGDASSDDVEARIGERDLLGAADHG